ncbi:hypothetical protein GCM10025882_22970 [Acinetobacter gyllenbergii]|uniref:Uncharacterized protein n=1 Tax=Acinetobacter gyllenbergii CIP 110306 = MTCC 11365 TaxID=1217657 RepID=A0A829HMC2_9GAMM|nr:hypothetical protein F957_00138 [Acinetobacter gyllenbergii CIP 110306 = MTCC 11365]EPH32369.1 hypothetical protein L293_1462 [Acinetobacter gyllenbergii CIP 110306 = MTCC 11365]GMA11872.1 hypothetical protein GCM10025882_22970 [Acinetobacter gyllenbergii]
MEKEKNKILMILAEMMMSVFIANFKASEHPIISAVARGILIMVTIFLWDYFLLFLMVMNFH